MFDFLELLNKEISLPNIPFPTMGGEIFWIDLAEFNGWRLQQNQITHHARIIDPENIRHSWGTYNGMVKAMNRIIKSYSQNELQLQERTTSYEQLKNLKELYDLGLSLIQNMNLNVKNILKIYNTHIST